MTSYYRIRLGKGAKHANECVSGSFVGVGYGLGIDLTNRLPNEWRDFNREFVPELQQRFPGKPKVTAGLQCAAIWNVAKGIKEGDIVISPGEADQFHIGEVTGPYKYEADGVLRHRRPVDWDRSTLTKDQFSPELWASVLVPGTVVWLEKHRDEIEAMLDGVPSASKIVATSPEIEDPLAFAMEKHLEDFLVSNWPQTSLGRNYQIIEEDGELVGQQYLTDSGPLDILAMSNDRSKLLVVELKRGRATDVVVGQVLRYMGFVQSELAESDQAVEGVIIALEDDPKMRRALQMVPSVRFMRYEVQFRLLDA